MNRKYLMIFILVLIGIILFGINWLRVGNGKGSQNGKLELEPFRNIDLRVMSGDVTVIEGESYELEYQLHGREKVKKAEVSGDTLYFDTGFDRKWKPGKGSWSVVITVPAGSSFDSVSLKSTAGDLRFSGYDFREGEFETTAGDIELSELTCDTLSANTVSHDISLTDSRISESAELETVSGKICSKGTPFGSVQAKSVGKILFNGEKQGREFHIEQGTPELEAASVSGRIVVETKE